VLATVSERGAGFLMAWIVHGSAVLGQSSDFPAAGAGLGVGPDLGCAGVGDFLVSSEPGVWNQSDEEPVIHKDDNDEVFILIDGTKIAKRPT
jgi:hypothetical protein